MGSIKKQGITNTIISYIGICIGFLNLIILQPFMLKAEEFGLTRIIYSFTLLVGTLFPVGLNYLTIKFFPRFKNKENGHNGYFGLLLLIAFIGYLITAVLIFLAKDYILIKYSNSPLFIEYFYYVFPISFCIGFTSIITGYCGAIFKTSVPSFLNDIYGRVFTTIIVTLYYSKLISFPIFIFLYASSYVIQLIVLLIYLKYLKAISLKINWPFFKTQNKKEIFKYTVLLAFASLASIGIRNIDVMLVGSYLDLGAVAIYTLGMTIGGLIEIPVNSLARIADTKISDAIQRNDMRMVKEVYQKSVKYLILIGGLIFVLLYANINEAITFLPAKYYGAKWVIIIIAFSAFINMATGINTSIIYYSTKYVMGTYLLIGMIVVSVSLNILLIPLYGIEGAALATSIALVLYNAAKFIIIKQHFQLQPYDFSVLKIVLAIIICFGVTFVFPHFENKLLHMVAITVTLTAIFGLLLIRLKVFLISDIKSLSVKKLFDK
jgi:O-antigen/teichoic acid export membrane protein